MAYSGSIEDAHVDGDEGATTVAPDDSVEDEKTLQLLTNLTSPISPPATSDGVGGLRGANGPSTPEDRRIWSISVPAEGTINLKLGFAPKEAREVEFDMPLCCAGMPTAPSMRKLVIAEGLRPRLQLSQSNVRFGERILRNAAFPYCLTTEVTNTDELALEWVLDTSVIPAGSGFTLTPSSGELSPKETRIVTISFAAAAAGAIDVSVPLFIDGGGGGERPYLQLSLTATAVMPRLSFDRPELLLPVVPLGHTSRASFYVVNEGYDNLQIEHCLPADSLRVPLSIDFPEGTLVGVSKDRLLCTISFSSRRATAFTANVEFIDTEGVRYPLKVSAATDNSLISLQCFLAARSLTTPLLTKEGRPPYLAEVAPAPRAPQESKEAAVTVALAYLSPSVRTDEEVASAIAEVSRSSNLALAYVCSSLMTLPPVDGAEGGGSFPSMLTQSKGAPAYELVQMLSGKAIPLPEAPTDRKNDKAALRYLLGSYEALLAFLRAHGAMLASAKAESMLPLDDYLKLVAGGAPLSRAKRSTLRRAHSVAHPEAWLELVMQLIKVFVLGRITPRSFRTLPGMLDAPAIATDPHLSTSNLYSSSEVLLLKWLAHHTVAADSEACAAIAAGTRTPFALSSFDETLRDGHVFAACILSHCPFLRASAGQLVERNAAVAAAVAANKPSEHAAAIDDLFPAPCSPQQAVANQRRVLSTLDGLGLSFSAMNRAIVLAEMIQASSARELLLFSLFLYQNLPHYVPKANVGFVGGLHERLGKSIELFNPAKKPIVYKVRLEGAPCYSIDERIVRLEGKQTKDFRIDCVGFFTGRHTGRLFFISIGDGTLTANASTLVFDLTATIDIGAPLWSFVTESKLYEPQTMAIAVTNPFGAPCTLKLGFTESRPMLDASKIAVAGTADEQKLSLRQGMKAVSAAARAAKMAGLAVSSLQNGAISGDDPSKKLPASFWCSSGTLSLNGHETAQLVVQFLPFQLGEYTCTLLFSDESVGEFSYDLKGVATLPSAIETVIFSCESGSADSKDVVLPFRNPLFEKARQTVLDRSMREKERMSQIWGKEAMQRGPISVQINYASSFFNGPMTCEMFDNERRGGRGAAGGRTPGGTSNSLLASVAHSQGASTVVTPRSGPVPPTSGASQAASTDNKLQLRFVPRDPGQYTAQALLLSPLDVRVYELIGSCAAPGMRASLEFTTSARQPVRQELPVVNNTSTDWTISAQLRGEDFRGPPSVKVAANSTGHYPLEFIPEWVCERSGELTLTNLNTSDKYNFALGGVAEEPLAEGNLIVDCAARVPTPMTFFVYNVSNSGDATALSIESDLLHVSGPPTISVPNRPRGGKAEQIEYILTANPQMGGLLQGSITFSAPDGRYLWYTVQMQVAPPPCERTLQISSPLRKVCAVEIPISNPASAELEFSVIITGEGLLGDESITVSSGESMAYELLFSPLVAGTSVGSISFINPSAGEFWYEIAMTGEAAPPIDMPLMHCNVGGVATQSLTIANPIGEEVALHVRVDNARNFRLEGPNGGPLLLPPYGEIVANVTFVPSALEEMQSATISVASPKLGEWVYVARGMGHVPSEMPTTEATAPLGHAISGTIQFRNPFEETLSLDAELTQPELAASEFSSTPPFELLARKTLGIMVPPGTSVQLPFSYLARDMAEHQAALLLHGSYHSHELTWTFPIVGEAVSRPLQKPLSFIVPARAPLRREIELPLPGLPASSIDEPFTFELDLAAADADIIGASLTLTPLQRSLAGGSLVMSIDWQPLRPLRTSAALVVRKASGGRWRYDMVLEAGEPSPDDIITIEAPIHKTAHVQFKLCNAFDVDAPFAAYFTPDSTSVFTVSPMAGVLTRAGTAGSLFTIAYTPVEYGKQVRGTLVVLTDEMQWTYAVRGSHPLYEVPTVAKTKVDHVLDPSLSMRLGVVPNKNFLKRNMQK